MTSEAALDGKGRYDEDQNIDPAPDKRNPGRHFVAPRNVDGADDQADNASGKQSLKASDDGVDRGDSPEKLPGDSRPANVHEQGDADGAKMEEGVEDEGPEQGEAPRVGEIVECMVWVLGRPAEAREAGLVIVWRRPFGAQSLGVAGTASVRSGGRKRQQVCR